MSAPLAEDVARRLTEDIRSLAETIASRVDRLVPMICEARDGQAHVALGYRSWTVYAETEFAGVLPRLDRQSRRELVTALTETGMSSRAIAPVVGVDRTTVTRDAVAGGASAPPAPVTGRDGKTYPRPESTAHVTQVERDVDTDTGEVIEPDPEPPPKPLSLPPAPPLRSPEQVNAEQFAERFAGQMVSLLALDHPHMRAQARRDWRTGSAAASPTQRGYVNPDHMRTVAHGLLALADEWERADEHAA